MIRAFAIHSAKVFLIVGLGVLAGNSIYRVSSWVSGSARTFETSDNELLIKSMIADVDKNIGKKRSNSINPDILNSRINQQKRPKLYPSPEIPPPGVRYSPIIRVALFSQSPPSNIRLEGMTSCNSGFIKNISTYQLNQLLDNKSVNEIYCEANAKGRIILNDRPYEKEIHLFKRKGSWLAVNEIDLERYVASVVGAEMPSHWHEEALKAQAVAARSYALAHIARPADVYFDLGDTTRWQVYGGSSTKTQSTQNATVATQGMILSYKGGIVESLYASTAEISHEAHRHLGASMSQHGAQALAHRGLKFNEILGSYYVGANLARLKNLGN